MPVAVSVPQNQSIEIEMTLASWAFGEIRGTPRP